MAEAFDTLRAARDLTTAGLDRDHAEAIANAIRRGQGELVTESDLKAEIAGPKTGMAEFKAELKSDLASQQRWHIGVLLATQALLFAALRYLGG